MFAEVIKTTGLIFLYLIALAVVILAFYLVIHHWRSIRAKLGYGISWLYGFLFGTNNRRAAFVGILFLLALGKEVYEFLCVLNSYFTTPVIEVATRNIKSIGWFVSWTVLVLALGLAALIYLPISRLDEFHELIQNIRRRFDRESGGVLKREQKGLISRWFEKVLDVKPVVATVAAATVAATTPGEVAAPVTPAVKTEEEEREAKKRKRESWLVKALAAEEVIEYLLKIFKRRIK